MTNPWGRSPISSAPLNHRKTNAHRPRDFCYSCGGLRELTALLLSSCASSAFLKHPSPLSSNDLFASLPLRRLSTRSPYLPRQPMLARNVTCHVQGVYLAVDGLSPAHLDAIRLLFPFATAFELYPWLNQGFRRVSLTCPSRSYPPASLTLALLFVSSMSASSCIGARGTGVGLRAQGLRLRVGSVGRPSALCLTRQRRH